MSPLRELLELYKLSLAAEKPEDFEVREVEEIPAVEVPDVPGYDELSQPVEGDVIELVPSNDGEEMVFLVFEVSEEAVTLLPLSRWIEFATPTDVFVKLSGKTYMAETDLSLDFPLDRFAQRFGDRRIFKIGELTPEEVQQVKDVIKGKKTGVGRISEGVKREFKRLEARRYLPLFLQSLREEEELQELEHYLLNYKEQVLAAAGQEQLWGDKENISWVYDPENEILNLIIPEELSGKRGRITLELQGRVFTLHEGVLKKEIKIPISREAYSHRVFMEGLKIALAE